MTTIHRSDYPGADRPAAVLIDADEAGVAVVGWSAIIGGAVAAAALGMLMVALGAGFGLAALRPWLDLSGPDMGASATTIGVAAVIWLIVVQWVSSAVGGYIAGRMRTRGERSDEVFFRDTVHGFLAWALACVVGAGLLTAVAGSIAGGGAELAAAFASGSASGGRDAVQSRDAANRQIQAPLSQSPSAQSLPGQTSSGAAQPSQTGAQQPPMPGTQLRGTQLGGAQAPKVATSPMVATESPSSRAVPARAGAGYEPFDYVIDAMFRSDRIGQAGQTAAGQASSGQSMGQSSDQAIGVPATGAMVGNGWELRSEAARILFFGAWRGDIPATDRSYLTRIVAMETGLGEAEASQRVDRAIQQIRSGSEVAQQAAEDARKAAASLSLFTAFAMLVGAFIAAVAGAIGGQHRDAL